MMDLVFSPKFVLEKMLNLSFNRSQVRRLQKLAMVSERTVYYWFSIGKMKKANEYRELMRKLSENESCLWCPATSEEFIKSVKDPSWGEFAATSLLSKENDFRLTMSYILRNQFENSNSLSWEGDLRRLGSCLPSKALNRLANNLKKRGLGQSQRTML